MQIALIPSQALSLCIHCCINFSTITDSDRGFLVICTNTTTTAFSALEPSATSSSRQQEKEKISQMVFQANPTENWSMGGPDWKILIFHIRIFMLDTISFSLEYPMYRCQMVHFGYEKKNFSWFELCQRDLGEFFVVESEKSHSV